MGRGTCRTKLQQGATSRHLLADGYELRISGADSTASKASNMPVISGGAGDAASSPFTPSAKSEHLFEIEARLVRGRSRRGRAGEAPTKVQFAIGEDVATFPTTFA